MDILKIIINVLFIIGLFSYIVYGTYTIYLYRKDVKNRVKQTELLELTLEKDKKEGR